MDWYILGSLVVSLILTILAIQAHQNSNESNADDKKLAVLCLFFPVFGWLVTIAFVLEHEEWFNKLNPFNRLFK